MTKTGQTAFISIENQTGLMEHAVRTLAGIRDGAPIAISRGLNRAADGARTDITRGITSRYVARAGDVRATMKVSRANPSRLEATVHIEGPRIPLIRFKVSPDKPFTGGKRPKVTRIMTSRGGGKVPYAGAFVQRMPSGHVGVFHRLGAMRQIKSGSNKGRIAQPIAEWFGPSIAEMAGVPDIVQAVEAGAYSRLEKTIDHEIGRLLRGAT